MIEGVSRNAPESLKRFGYEKEGIRLNFSLSVDTTKELLIFLDLMEAAKMDLDSEIERITKKQSDE